MTCSFIGHRSRSRKCLHRRAALGADALPAEHAAQRHQHDLCIQREADVIHIIHIIGKAVFPAQGVAAVDLRKPGQTGAHGMAAALGTQFLNAKGQPFLPVGETLHLVKGVRLNGFFFQKNAPRIEALCDVENPLYGTNGAAYVFGPQKGADANEVKRLDAGLRVVAGLFEKQGAKVNSLPGGGAAGGAGAGVACFLNGRIASGIDVLLDLMKFDDLVKTADLIVTGEGSVDGQTAGGKAVQGIARRAAGKPVIVFSGSAKLDPASWEKLRASGVAAVFPIVQEPCTLAEAMAKASDNLRVTALNVFSLLKLQQTAGLTQQHA